MNLNVEISQYDEHFFIFSLYQDPDKTEQIEAHEQQVTVAFLVFSESNFPRKPTTFALNLL